MNLNCAVSAFNCPEDVIHDASAVKLARQHRSKYLTSNWVPLMTVMFERDSPGGVSFPNRNFSHRSSIGLSTREIFGPVRKQI